MSARTHADRPPPEAAAADARRAPAPAPAPGTATADLLALQRTAGNAAVVRLLRRAGTPAPASIAATQSARDWFIEQMRARWNITDIRAGTEADQVADMRRMTQSAQASPTSISGWQAWDPAASSDLYADILDGFDALGNGVGGIPPVSEIRFLDVAYDNQAGVATSNPDEAASYSAGRVRIYKKIETADWPLPDGRSTRQARAALTTGGRSKSRRRIITHELCHGVYEQAGAADPGIFAAWAAAGGWSGGHIVQSGTVLDRANWNDPWPEQPVSRYSLSNPMEDFCESLTCYIERPQVLAARSPSRYEFIRSRASGWRAHLQPSMRVMSPPGDYYGPPDDRRYA